MENIIDRTIQEMKDNENKVTYYIVCIFCLVLTLIVLF